MIKKIVLLCIISAIISSCKSNIIEENTRMTNLTLLEILKENSQEITGQLGYWEVSYNNSRILIITDENHNRMRMISPISKLSELENSQVIVKALEANFHTALDTKYAISNEIMWSVFIHPLKELTKHQVIDALKQVAKGAQTFGNTYSSTDLSFPGNEEEQSEEL